MYSGRLVVVSEDSLRADVRLRWVRRGLGLGEAITETAED